MGCAALFVVSDVGLRHCRSMSGCSIFVGVQCCHGDVWCHHEGVTSLLGCMLSDVMVSLGCGVIVGVWHLHWGVALLLRHVIIIGVSCHLLGYGIVVCDGHHCG